MGTLVQHGEGDGAIWTYAPIGRAEAYEKIDTASLLLLAVGASRLVWRQPHDGVYNAWRIVLDVARGRRPPLSNVELDAAEDRLPAQARRDEDADDGHSFSIKFVAGPTGVGSAISPDDARGVVAKVLHLAWDHYCERYDNAPLGDRLSHAVVDLLGKVAFLLRDDDRALERLRDLELRCLVHGWTYTHDVVPRAVVQSLTEATSRNDAQARARAWRLGPEPSPFPQWTPPPPTPEELARREAQRLAVEAEQRRWEAMSPEERAEAERERAALRLYATGLINRDVQ